MKKTIASTIVCIAALIPNCYQGACLAQQATNQAPTSQVSRILGKKPVVASSTRQQTSKSKIQLVGAQFPLPQQKSGSNPLVPLATQAKAAGNQAGQYQGFGGGSPLKPLISKKQPVAQNPLQPLQIQKPAPKRQAPANFAPVPIIRPIVNSSAPVSKSFAAPPTETAKSLSSPYSQLPTGSQIPVVQAPIVQKTQTTPLGTPKPQTIQKIAQKSLASSTTAKKSSPSNSPKQESTLPKPITNNGWKEIETTGTSVASKSQETESAKTDSPKAKVKPVSTKIAESKPKATTGQQTTPQAIASQSTEDQIRVEEVSDDQLLEMLLGSDQSQEVGPGIPSVVNSSIVPRPKRQKAKTFQISNAKQVLHGQQEHFGDIQPEPQDPSKNGLNFTHTRPDCINELKYDGCGTVSGARGYFFADALYMDRSDGNFSASFLPASGGFSYNWGGRFTIGKRFDSIEGWEMSFTGIDAWTRTTVNTSPGGGLFSRLAPVGGFTPLTLAGFNNGLQHASIQRGHYSSFEFSRMNWNWDVLSTFIGFRYNGVDDQYALNSISAIAANSYRIRARNNMIGLQIGGEFFYDIGRRVSFSAKGKLAGYVNIAQTDTELFLNASQLVDNQDDEANLAWGADLGFYTRYNLTPRAKLRFGYEFWYLGEMATVENQFNGFISPFSGLDLDNEGDVFNHGAIFGFEWYR